MEENNSNDDDNKLYSFGFIFDDWLVKAWDFFAGNYFRILPSIIIFSLVDVSTIIATMYLPPYIVAAYLILLVFPLQVSKNHLFIQAVRGETKLLNCILYGFKHYMASLSVFLIFSIGMLLGLSLYIIPGIIFILFFFMSTYYVADMTADIPAYFKLSYHSSKPFVPYFFIGIILFSAIMLGAPSVAAFDVDKNTIVFNFSFWNCVGFLLLTLIFAPYIQIVKAKAYETVKTVYLSKKII